MSITSSLTPVMRCPGPNGLIGSRREGAWCRACGDLTVAEFCAQCGAAWARVSDLVCLRCCRAAPG